MKKFVCSLSLVLAMALTLSSCGVIPRNPFQGKNAPSTSASQPPQDADGGASSQDPDGSAAPDEAEEAKTIQGTVNRSGDYLVLLTADSEYLVFDFGPEVDIETFEEGDDVTVAYTGELGSEDPVPVAVSITKDK